jgi:hypothetical protein
MSEDCLSGSKMVEAQEQKREDQKDMHIANGSEALFVTCYEMRVFAMKLDSDGRYYYMLFPATSYLHTLSLRSSYV